VAVQPSKSGGLGRGQTLDRPVAAVHGGAAEFLLGQVSPVSLRTTRGPAVKSPGSASAGVQPAGSLIRALPGPGA